MFTEYTEKYEQKNKVTCNFRPTTQKQLLFMFWYIFFYKRNLGL